MQTSDRISRLGFGVFDRNDRLKDAYRRSSKGSNGFSLVDLSLGSSDIAPPPAAIAAIEESLGLFDSSTYCLHAATRPFRETVSEWCKWRFGIDVDASREVLFLVGSQEGTAHLPLAILNPGDRGLILDPSYPSHRGGMVLANASIQSLQLSFENNWHPNFGLLSSSHLDQLRMMTLGFPHNPTATVGHQSFIDEVMDLGVRHDFVVAHDNPYVDLALEGESPVLLRSKGWRERGIEFFSFSKAWCMGGFRMAFAIGAEPLISALKKIKSVVDFNQSLALQQGAIAALTKAPDWPIHVRNVYMERRDRTIRALTSIGWNVPIPSMSLYLWMPIPNWAKERGFDDEHLAAELLDKTGIALTPGSGFGAGGANWLRLALVLPSEELELAVARLKPWWNEQS